MKIAFFDEFGHCGPVISRTDPRHKTSPVFGLAGYIMPDEEVRHFATFFLQLKQFMLAHEIKNSGVHPATWEKKGSSFITTKNIRKYSGIRTGVHRLLNELYKCDGRIVYHGREKYQSPELSNSKGLYATVLSHTMRSSDAYCGLRKSNFMMILDQHSDRIKLLESATKTMFGQQPTRYLLEPPFQVESHLYQTVQAADWIATLIGRWMAWTVEPNQYADWKWVDDIYGTKLRMLCTNSSLWRPAKAQKNLHFEAAK